MKILQVKCLFIIVLATCLYSCQKELYNPTTPIISPANPTPVIVKKIIDTFYIRAFYGHQGITPPSVGTVIFPQYNYEVPVANKMAFMSAYTGLNGYGDSAGMVKKNAINTYNGEFYNDNVNAQGNTWITITPINHPVPNYSDLSANGTIAHDKFFTQSKQILITISLVNGIFSHSDTAANGQITNYRIDKLYLIAMESVEAGLATSERAQKLKNGQSETYSAFINQKGVIMLPLKNTPDSKPVDWHPNLFK